MRIREFQVETVGLEQVCEVCNTGVLEHNDNIKVIWDKEEECAKFTHRCNHCGAEELFDNKYPTVVHRKIQL